MTSFQYQTMMAKRDAATATALAFLRAGDTYLFSFWASAARAYEARALDDSAACKTARLQAEVSDAMEQCRKA